MTTALNRKGRLFLVLFGSLAALSLGLLTGSGSAQAATSNYCTGWLGGQQDCGGAARSVYQVYGWGDQGAVCVGIYGWTGPSCSSGAGSGVYSGRMPSPVYSSLYMHNNSNGSNFVHGVALQP